MEKIITAPPAEDTPTRPKIDYSRLTLGEVDKIETLSGQPVASLDDENAPKGRLLAALVFVASRRYGEPKTWEACLDMPMLDATGYLGLDDDEDDEDGTEALDDDEDAPNPKG